MNNDTSDNDERPLYRPTIPSLGTYHIRYPATPESFRAARLRRIKQLRKWERQQKNILKPPKRFNRNE